MKDTPTVRTRSLWLAAVLTAAVCAPAAHAADSDLEAKIDAQARETAALMAQVTKVQQDFLDASTRYEVASAAAKRARADATRSAQAATAAQRASDQARRGLARLAAQVYTGGGTVTTADAATTAFGMMGASDPAAYLNARADLVHVQGARGVNVAALNAVRDDARSAAQRAQDAARAADGQARSAQRSLQAAQQRATDVTASMSRSLVQASTLGGAAGVEQEALNMVARKAWASYGQALRDAKVILPPAREVAAPAGRFPKGLTVLRGADGKPSAGVALARSKSGTVPVISREAFAAVSGALTQIDRPYVPDERGPEAFDCSGLTFSSWKRAGVTLPVSVAGQWVHGRAVPVSDVQPGDLVFVADPRSGLHHVGIAVSPGLMVAASSASFTVGAARIPAHPFGVVRPGLPGGKPNQVPARAKSAPVMRCGSANTVPPLSASAPDATGGKGGAPAGQGRAWGGYSNGMIPRSALCPISADESLRCDAARAFALMNATYRAKFKTGICITDGYRPYAEQVVVFGTARPGYAAFPGRSTHGWALAADLCGGIQSFGTPQYAWMKANAARFGWFHPSWAEPNGVTPEPWHWEYGLQR